MVSSLLLGTVYLDWEAVSLVVRGAHPTKPVKDLRHDALETPERLRAGFSLLSAKLMKDNGVNRQGVQLSG